jgi:outer membrane usher protein
MLGAAIDLGLYLSAAAFVMEADTAAQSVPPAQLPAEDLPAQSGPPAQPPFSSEPPKQSATRSLAFSVPLVSADRVFGDILIRVEAQQAVSVDAAGLRRELSNIINESGLEAFDRAVNGQSFVEPETLKAGGFELEFNSRQLELSVVRVNPEYLKVQQLGGAPSVNNRIELNRIEPERFSTYMNVTGNFDYDTRSGNDTPDFFLDGATRIGGFVVEYDAALTDQFGGSYDFFRRSTRVVYDDPSSYRRYSAGDLRLNSLSILRTPQIAGFAVEKSRTIFDPFSSVTRLAGRQIFLDNRSSVDVLINGTQFDSFQLDAGTYDLASLPIQQGSNDIKLVVRDSFGRQQIIDYNFFFENLELPAGQEEYSFGIGFLSNSFGFEPSYSKDIAASGYYRKALSTDLIVGGAIQLSEDAQVLGGTISVVPQIVPGVFNLEAATSRSRGQTGFALRAGYRYQTSSVPTEASQFSIDLDYESGGFRTIDNVLPINFDILSISATYSKAFSEKTFGVVGANYLRRGGQAPNDYTGFVEINHRLSDKLRLTVGAEYGSSANFGRNVGVRVGVTMALGGSTRASAEYRSRTDSLRANLSRGADNQVGSFGYDIGVSRFGDDTQADLQLEYNANRFAARADLNSSGNSLGGIFDDQRARLQIGTSIAYAGGSVGIGRPISNSFMLAKPHPALKDQGVMSARTLTRGNFYARSGALGSAVQGDLSPYNNQNIQFDAADPVDGFDVGDGTILVNPPYKSGYRLIVGSENYVSVIGRIADSTGPVALVTGEVRALNPDDAFQGLPFFTNSSGRFGIFGLAPGKKYEVLLPDTQRQFIIEIPAEGDAVFRMDTIILPAVE